MATGEKVVPNVRKYMQFGLGSTLQGECLAALQLQAQSPIYTQWKPNKG